MSQEILDNILGRFDHPIDLIRLGKTCKTLNESVGSSSAWCQFLKDSNVSKPNPRSKKSRTWKLIVASNWGKDTERSRLSKGPTAKKPRTRENRPINTQCFANSDSHIQTAALLSFPQEILDNIFGNLRHPSNSFD
ncbi:hypothetical protein BC829DRAFT_28635 [Chytridium lagenaria]|nr:hypothetical protein BC829DRAFT_28635 [Chytridium lagenaria]